MKSTISLILPRTTRSSLILTALGLMTVAAPAGEIIPPPVPKVILISLDGATPSLIQSSNLPAGTGLRLLETEGVKASRNNTVNPSLTAVAHIAIATGSTAAANDIVANSFQYLASPFNNTVSGFGAAIGGYSIDGPMESIATAEPLWLALRANGKKVATATWPGGDGVNVTIPGLTGAPGSPTNPIIQPASERTVDFTVPFGAFSALTGVPSSGAHGYSLTASDFSAAPPATATQLDAADPTYLDTTPVLQKTTPLASFSGGGQNYVIQVAAYDTTNDSVQNYDKIVVFNQAQGVTTGSGLLPSTGSAFIRPVQDISAPFYLEGHSNKAGMRFFVTQLSPDLSSVRIAHSSANFIPRNAAVLADVDDINNNVGFWQPQPDFRIPERISPGFGPFPDIELEGIYSVLVRGFTRYQTDLGLRAITRIPDADLVMIYLEQPDGSSHQYLLTDPRQPTDFLNPNSIGGGQDQAKKDRYANYIKDAYLAANEAVQRVIDFVGTTAGVPNSNILVTSDHGMAPFHTAVQVSQILTNAGITGVGNTATSRVKVVTSGPAANVYINLIGREPAGVVTKQEYIVLQKQIADALRNARDTNPTYAGPTGAPLFDKIYPRPLPADINDPSFGRRTTEEIGQDSGDVYALLHLGYNFDGRQNPVVIRSGDTEPVPNNAVLTVPNFYGAHGYDPAIEEMSAVFYAAGPDIDPGTLGEMSNIDIAPTIQRMLGVTPAGTVTGTALPLGPAPFTLTSVASRKTHGAAGEFDFRMPLTGTRGVESRPAVGGSHTVVFTFSNPVVGASAATDVGFVANTTFVGNEFRVFLGGIPDGQKATITLTNVADSSGSITVPPISIGFLHGDVTRDGIVNAADTAETKSLVTTPAPISPVNVAGDVKLDGKLTIADSAVVKSKQGSSVAP